MTTNADSRMFSAADKDRTTFASVLVLFLGLSTFDELNVDSVFRVRFLAQFVVHDYVEVSEGDDVALFYYLFAVFDTRFYYNFVVDAYEGARTVAEVLEIVLILINRIGYFELLLSEPAFFWRKRIIILHVVLHNMLLRQYTDSGLTSSVPK